MTPNFLFNEATVIVALPNGVTLSKTLDSPKSAKKWIESMSEKLKPLSDEDGTVLLVSDICQESNTLTSLISTNLHLKRAYDLLKTHNVVNHFFVENNTLFIKVENEYFNAPKSIIDYILRFENDPEAKKGLTALENFLLLLLNNPNERVRINILEFMINHKFELEENGLIIAYRNCVPVGMKASGDKNKEVKKSKDSEKEKLISFLNNEYLNIKKKKKGLSKFNVFLSSTGYASYAIDKNQTESMGTLIGNFHDLYEEHIVNSDDKETEVPVETFTDDHSKTTTIQFGKPVELDIKDCDTDPNQDCSRGLHFGNINFMKTTGFGSQSIMILVNPAHIVAVPYADRGKARCSKYLPVAKVERNEDGIVPIDVGTFSYEYLNVYYKKELEDAISSMRKNVENTYNSRKVSEIIDIEILNILKSRIDKLPSAAIKKVSKSKTFHDD